MMIDYKADGYTELQVEFNPLRYEQFLKFADKNGWQSPYFLPKEAARIFLEVTDVRVERLQDITEEQAVKEGMSYLWENNYFKREPYTATDAFSMLWNSTILKQDLDKYSWQANPYIWVYEFERVDKSEVTI